MNDFLGKFAYFSEGVNIFLKYFLVREEFIFFKFMIKML